MKDEAERAAQVGDTLASTTSMSVVQTTSAPANVNVPKDVDLHGTDRVKKCVSRLYYSLPVLVTLVRDSEYISNGHAFFPGSKWSKRFVLPAN